MSLRRRQCIVGTKSSGLPACECQMSCTRSITYRADRLRSTHLSIRCVLQCRTRSPRCCFSRKRHDDLRCINLAPNLASGLQVSLSRSSRPQGLHRRYTWNLSTTGTRVSLDVDGFLKNTHTLVVFARVHCSLIFTSALGNPPTSNTRTAHTCARTSNTLTREPKKLPSVTQQTNVSRHN